MSFMSAPILCKLDREMPAEILYLEFRNAYSLRGFLPRLSTNGPTIPRSKVIENIGAVR